MAAARVTSARQRDQWYATPAEVIAELLAAAELCPPSSRFRLMHYRTGLSYYVTIERADGEDEYGRGQGSPRPVPASCAGGRNRPDHPCSRWDGAP